MGLLPFGILRRAVMVGILVIGLYMNVSASTWSGIMQIARDGKDGVGAAWQTVSGPISKLGSCTITIIGHFNDEEAIKAGCHS